MLLVGFELTIPMFELAKAVHILGRAATVIGAETYALGADWFFNCSSYSPQWLHALPIVI
jgi:hypothetical protein